MVAYLDLIILENLCMNYLIVYTTGKLLCRKTKKIKLFLASCVGSIYLFSLFINVSTIILNMSKIFVALVMIKISFSTNCFKNIMKELLVFLFVSFIYSGCALGFIHMFKPKIIYIVNGTIIGGEYIFELVLISAGISFLLIKYGTIILRLKQKITKEDMLCEVTLYNKKKSVKTRALLDTGNLLTDVTTGSPVIIVEKNIVKELFEEQYFRKVNRLIEGGDFECNDFDDKNIKIIPYMSLGNRNGIIIGYKIEKIKVEYQEKLYEIADVIIGFYNEALTKNGKYSSLIGLQILERGTITNEYNTDIEGKGKYSVC